MRGGMQSDAAEVAWSLSSLSREVLAPFFFTTGVAQMLVGSNVWRYALENTAQFACIIFETLEVPRAPFSLTFVGTQVREGPTAWLSALVSADEALRPCVCGDEVLWHRVE